MAHAFTMRTLQTVGGGSGFARAKKLAALALKTNVNDKGETTELGYQQAAQYIQPFINAPGNDAIDAQRLVATYNNSISSLGQKKTDQNQTVAKYKIQEQNAYFSSFEGDVGGMRDPAKLVNDTSNNLDNIALKVQNAIDENKANDQPTDALQSYLQDIQKRSDSMRDLRNRLNSGELAKGQTLDGFGYYVDTNPIDGSVRRAAIMPVGMAPAGMDSGFKRLASSAQIGGAMLPVYAPAQKNADGEYVAKIGSTLWTGTGDQSLTGQQDSAGRAQSGDYIFQDGGFDLKDRNVFPSQKNDLSTGTFGKGYSGIDAQGNPVETTVYKTNDGSIHTVDDATLAKMQADPILSQKLNGYVTRFSPAEMSKLTTGATKLPDFAISAESSMVNSQDLAAKAVAASQVETKQNSFFGKVVAGAKDVADKSIRGGILGAVLPGGAATAAAVEQVNTFAKNNPNVPDAPPSIAGSVSDLVDKGKSFFRKTFNGIIGQ